jgi:hypothetical protein
MPSQDFLNAFSGTLGNDFLGPKYNYHTKIKSPKELGMSPDGNMSALAKDIAGIVSYTELLIEGGGGANRTGRALGDKFFLKLPSKCRDVTSGKEVTRYSYVDNQIDGNIPLPGFEVSTGLKGLIPGAISDVLNLNPMVLLKGFAEGSKPWCKAVTKDVINDKNQKYEKTHHVALNDLDPNELDSNDRAKLSKFKEDAENNNKDGQCEGFSNYNSNFLQNIIDDELPRTYIFGVSLLYTYILYRMMHK